MWISFPLISGLYRSLLSAYRYLNASPVKQLTERPCWSSRGVSEPRKQTNSPGGGSHYEPGGNTGCFYRERGRGRATRERGGISDSPPADTTATETSSQTSHTALGHTEPQRPPSFKTTGPRGTVNRKTKKFCQDIFETTPEGGGPPNPLSHTGSFTSEGFQEEK